MKYSKVLDLNSQTTMVALQVSQSLNKLTGNLPSNYKSEKSFLLTVVYIEITSWKARAYGIFTRVGEVSEIERVSAANK